MSMEDWLPLAELARRCNVPESTARRYARMFGDFLPFARDGRTVLFDPRCGDVLRRIGELFGEGRTAQQVQDVLRREAGIIDVGRPEAPAGGMVSGQVGLATMAGDNGGARLTGFLEQLVDQKQEIAALRNDVSMLARDLVVERERRRALESQNQSFRRVLVALLRKARAEKDQCGGDLATKLRLLEERLNRLSASRRDVEGSRLGADSDA